MKFRVKPASAASLLILMMITLGGQREICHRTEYQFGEGCCPTCPAGQRVQTDCGEVKSTSCRPCSEGTFMNKPTGFKHCFPCSDCEEAAGLRIKTPCTKKSDTGCEPLEGFYCSVSAEDGGCAAARRHRSCRPGQHITHTGTSQRDTECSNCTTGTFSDGTFTSCQLHTQCETENLLLLKPGTDSSDAECGERGSDRTVVIVIAVVVIIFLLIGSAVLFHLSKKIKRRRNIVTGKKRRELEAQCVEMRNSEDKPHEAFISALTD